MSLLVSCETGGDRIPSRLAVAGPMGDRPSGDDVDGSSRQEDSPPAKWLPQLPASLPGDTAARHAARRLARELSAPLIENPYSPSLIDVSHSVRHRKLFSPLTRRWPGPYRDWLVENVHRPYRQHVRRQVAGMLLRDRFVIHLSLHTFAAVKQGQHRRADVGLLYDPQRDHEVDFCLDWIDELYDAAPMLKVRRNYPRRGTNDSLTKSMRAEFAELPYLGIEVQLNRAWAGRPVAVRDQVLDAMAAALRELLAACQADAA